MVDGDPELGSVVGVYMFKVHLGVGPKLSKTMPRPPAIRLGLVVESCPGLQHNCPHRVEQGLCACHLQLPTKGVSALPRLDTDMCK